MDPSRRLEDLSESEYEEESDDEELQTLIKCARRITYLHCSAAWAQLRCSSGPHARHVRMQRVDGRQRSCQERQAPALPPLPRRPDAQRSGAAAARDLEAAQAQAGWCAVS